MPRSPPSIATSERKQSQNRSFWWSTANSVNSIFDSGGVVVVLVCLSRGSTKKLFLTRGTDGSNENERNSREAIRPQ